MLVTNDEALALRMRAIRNFGQMPGQHFRHAFLGGNYKMTDVLRGHRLRADRQDRRLHRGAPAPGDRAERRARRARRA